MLSRINAKKTPKAPPPKYVKIISIKSIPSKLMMPAVSLQEKYCNNCWCPLAGEAANAQAAAVMPGQTLAGPSARGPADRGYAFQSLELSFIVLGG